MGAKFEKVKRFENEDIQMPSRATANSAGYDLYVAEDTVIPSLFERIYNSLDFRIRGPLYTPPIHSLSEAAFNIKIEDMRPTLVSTGVKCKLDPGTYLELSVRSSTPLKYLLILANGVGIVDADYYGNPDNDGEIFLQLINLGPNPVILRKGDRIGQGIIKPYLITEVDVVTGERLGGFGSTSVSLIDENFVFRPINSLYWLGCC